MNRDRLVPIGEAARMLGVSRRTIRRWEARGILTCKRTPGGHRRVWLSDIKRLQGLLARSQQQNDDAGAEQ